MRCHYEVLGVSRDAEESDIKKKYRKLALQYHPDKNSENLADCTRLFHEIQSAYEVLGDKQERAWYDKYRERILRGGDDFIDDSLDVWHYFQPSVFSGYKDGPEGFYTIFRDVFKKLSEEDEPFDGDEDEEVEVPQFGDSTSDYDDVVKTFYSYWLGYCTKKSFVWKEKYDLKQAPNRPTQRLMEKENKKLRDAARKKRNEEVRGLVAYVRKRDKRVQAYRKQLEEKNAENQRKLEKRREEDIRRNNQLRGNYEEQEWMTFDHAKLNDIDSHFDEQFGNRVASGSDSEEEKVDHFYCIACDKTFKSEKALANHEKSKKHKENVELIKNELAEELLEDLRIDDKSSEDYNDEISSGEDSDNQEGISNLPPVNPSDYERISSLNLPENVVKLNVIEKGEKTQDQCSENKNVTCKNSNDNQLDPPPIHHTDSLIYTKLKGVNVSRGSLKVKEKKKKGKIKTSDQVFLDDDEEEDWIARHEHVKLNQQDSLAMPRKKTKKQELKEAAERVRIDVNDVPINKRNASLGKSPITNSLKLAKRPTKADRKKGRRKLLGIQESENSDDEENEDGLTFTARVSGEDDSNENTDDEDETGFEDSDGKRSPTLQGSIIADSIRYNKEHMDHTGKKLLAQKYEAALKKEEEDDNDIVYLDPENEFEQASLPSPRSVHRSFICDSIRYNKDHIEPKGKHILQQKNEEKRNSLESKEKLEKRNSKKGNSSQMTAETFACEVCAKEYSTRNKLFEHIKTEGHAIVKESPRTSKKGKKGKNKK